MTETLNADEIRALEQAQDQNLDDPWFGAKALRIIRALGAALEREEALRALVSSEDSWRGGYEMTDEAGEALFGLLGLEPRCAIAPRWIAYRLAAATELLDKMRDVLAEADAIPNRAKFREHAWRYLDLMRDILANV